ncbi:MAG: tRNA uridine-5-carboxymethylaminomethyl(34) synthesis GTPase MnmE [Salinispira sp.]
MDSDVFPNLHDAIASLATPSGRSALAVIRTSGKESIEQISTCFSDPEKLRTAPGHTMIHGWLQDGEHKIDEVTLGIFRSPRSYTGENSVEIYCHGSVPGVRKIMDILLRSGFRQAAPGEFTLRAFIHGKMDLTRAEAVQELVNAQTSRAQNLALHRLAGGVYEEIGRITSDVADITAAVSVQLDYPEDELPSDSSDSQELEFIPVGKLNETVRSLRRLCKTYKTGRLYQEGVRVALAGRTNAGKSSLFNLLLREDRAIVSEVHGTTRDYLEAAAVLDDIPLRLYDTAGFRAADEFVEQEGIRRSAEVLQSSGIILYLVDGSGNDEFEHDQLAEIRALGIPLLLVWTKTDLPHTPPAPEGFIPLSTVSAEGLGELQAGMKELILGDIEQGSESDILIDSLRQKQLLDRAVGSLEQALSDIGEERTLDIIALDLQDALGALGEITGEVSSEEILDRIFSEFCLGK